MRSTATADGKHERRSRRLWRQPRISAGGLWISRLKLFPEDGASERGELEAVGALKVAHPGAIGEDVVHHNQHHGASCAALMNDGFRGE